MPVRRAIIYKKKKSTKNKCWRGCGEREPSYTVAAAKLCQSCLTLCDPIDGSPPGSSFHGIFQARVLEWVTSAFSTFTVGGNANWYSHYGEQCEDSLKNQKQNFYMTQESHCWAYTPRKPESKETMYPNVHCRSIYNSQDMEATQMSISRSVDKEVVIHIHNGILLSYKKECI